MSKDPIEIVGLRRNFGNFVAVDDLTLTVKNNSFTGFLGPNGAGKSTTLKILTHLIKASSGEAFINGIDVTKDPESALAEVGTVLETPEFYPYLTPVETMMYLGKIHGMNNESLSAKIPALIEQVKMEEWADKRIGTFSKGMKQRIAIAQALLSDPTVLIFDEPTSGLDPRGMIEVRDILKSLKTYDLTIFMSSHMLYEVSDLCDRIALIDHGRLIVHDDTEKIMNAGGGRVIKIKALNFDSMVPQILKEIEALPNVTSADIDDGSISVKLNGGDSDQASLLKEVTGMGLSVYSISNDNLESIYLDLIKDSR
jgi:ABC-2 type transport system ATP-binding protein